ncbi:MAG TPA: MBL fold metallo-hydrolase [Alphaproteobacteria bacterium]|nr:MBL fold metallo-hydrolase [Alphaproteobacteria bacterium]
METRIDEIAPGILRLSTLVTGESMPQGFTFNQFLVMADEPLLFHCGLRGLFPSVSAAAARVLPLESLRWIGFGHVEADECGAMNQWLAAAPRAEIVHGLTGCEVSINDLADRLPRVLTDGTVLDLGGKRIRFIETPHVPHGWEACVLFEETTGTLLGGDLFSHMGNGLPAVTSDDLVGPAAAAEDMFKASALTPQTAPTIRKLAALKPRTIAVMHGSSFSGDGAAALHALADDYARRLEAAMREA